MELQNFISETLFNIHKGVEEANKLSGDKNHFILGYTSNKTDETISFDIAVTVEAGGKAGGKISVPIIKLDGEIEAKGNYSKISRIQFRVHPNYEY